MHPGTRDIGKTLAALGLEPPRRHRLQSMATNYVVVQRAPGAPESAPAEIFRHQAAVSAEKHGSQLQSGSVCPRDNDLSTSQ
eukprot:Skav220332  [mRNA]  locus=scaffold1726:9438:9683:- [translate_table: standard]